MKKTLLILAALCASAAPVSAGSPRRLADFKEVLAALERGGAVQAVLDYRRCELLSLKRYTSAPSGEEETSDPACALSVQNKPETCYHRRAGGLDAVGGMRVSTWEYFGRGFTGPRAYVAASDTKLISIRGFVLNYAGLKIYEDGAVRVKANYLKTANDLSAAASALAETPLRAGREQQPVTGKKLAPQEYLVVMDELFDCRLGAGASFFEAR